MADVPASLDSVYRIVGALERVRMPYAFIGGVALNTWGVPRATFDLDLTFSVPTGRDGELLGELRRIGVVVEEAFEGGFRDRVERRLGTSRAPMRAAISDGCSYLRSR
jgi:hypothetical protein